MNLIKSNQDHLGPTLSDLNEEKVKLLARLGDIYAEEARLRFLSDALESTKHFDSRPSTSISLPTYSGDLSESETHLRRIQPKKDT